MFSLCIVIWTECSVRGTRRHTGSCQLHHRRPLQAPQQHAAAGHQRGQSWNTGRAPVSGWVWRVFLYSVFWLSLTCSSASCARVNPEQVFYFLVPEKKHKKKSPRYLFYWSLAEVEEGYLAWFTCIVELYVLWARKVELEISRKKENHKSVEQFITTTSSKLQHREHVIKATSSL